MANCSAGCIADFLCNGAPSLPEPGATLAPYVRLTITGAVNITVGNKSSEESGNTAIIKSFQFGTSDGAGTSVEIIDEEGGDFERAMDKLNKCITSANRDYRMTVQFGWITADCQGGSSLITNETYGDPFYFIPISIESDYTEGKIRFTITGTSLLEVVFETRTPTSYPKQSLKSAIAQLMADGSPVITNIQYLRRTPDGGTDSWGFGVPGYDGNGPVRPWQSHNKNKLSVAMDWIKPYRTDQGKGIRVTWDETAAGGGVIFWEDPESCDSVGSGSCTNSLGSYIVNGGNCSPVLSFTPKAKWTYGALHANSGGVGGAASNGTTPNQPLDCLKQATDANTGIQITGTTDNANRDTGTSSDDMQKAAAAHAKANKRIYSMEAELRIQGDPKLAGIKKTFGKTVSIVVINPFYLGGGGNGDCGDWLAQPGCNPVYSNKAWWVKGIDHSIKEGSYVTTLKLVLASPGSDIGPDDVFGGNGSGGWRPITPCSN